jgi:NDP-sugar pyrophosphorylase family protein
VIKKALIYAAGKGTRLKPFTESHPKALALVNDVPLLERNIKYLQSFGVTEFVINVHHFGEQIVEFLEKNNHFGAKIDISDEKDELLETGGGLLFAQKYLENEENFLIMNADILTDLNIHELVKFHETHLPLATLAVSDRNSSRKLFFNSEMVLKGWMNKNSGETKMAELNNDFKELAFSGIHCINSSIFDKIKRRGKFSIMDEYLDLMFENNILGFQHEARLIDVGRPESVIEAEKYFK